MQTRQLPVTMQSTVEDSEDSIAMSTIENRDAPRRKLSMTAVVGDRNWENSIDCVVSDGSQTGCRLKSDRITELPDEIYVKIASLKQPIKGNIVWRRADAAGVQFQWDRSQKSDDRPKQTPKTEFSAVLSDRQGQAKVNCLVQHASASGCLLIADDIAALPDEISLKPEGVSASVAGRIVWRNDNVAGVRFVYKDAKASHATAGSDADEHSKGPAASADPDQNLAKHSSKLGEETDELLTLIEATVDSAGALGRSIDDVESTLRQIPNSNKFKTVVSSLVDVSREMSETNIALTQQLSNSGQQIKEIHDKLEAVRHKSLTAALTEATDRFGFDPELEQMIAASESSGQPLSLVVIGIDHFKQFNDSFGHQTGDQVLKMVADQIRQGVRDTDLVAQSGGEEFAVILPNAPPEKGALLADRVRQQISGKELFKKATNQSLGNVTLSAGVAGSRPGDTAASLTARADGFLTEAKRAGRNRVEGDASAGAGMESSTAASG